MPRPRVVDVQRYRGETRDVRHLPLRKEPAGDATHIEDLDSARMQTACARTGEVVSCAPLDNGTINPHQRQLAREYQPSGDILQ